MTTRRHGVWKRLLLLFAALALVVAACTSTESDDEAADESPEESSEEAGADEETDAEGTDPSEPQADDEPEPPTETSASAEPETRTTRGVSDDSVKVGGVLYSGNFGGADVGAAARFARANAEGGVSGRMIEFIGAPDDGSDTVENQAIIERHVRQDEVFAVVPVVTATLAGVDFMEEENVPYFGWGVDPGFCGHDLGFGFTGCVTDPNLQRGSNAAGTALADFYDGDVEGKTVALIAEDWDAGRGGLVLLEKSFEDGGFEVVYSEAVVPPPGSPPAPSFQPFVNDIMASTPGGPDVVMHTLSTSNALQMLDALANSEFAGRQMVPFYDPRLVASDSIQGALILTQIAPYELANEIPEIQQMLDDVAAEDPEVLLNLGVAAGYWAADHFLALLESVGEDLTVETFIAAQDGFEYEVPAVIGPSTWPENHDEPVPCAALSLVENSTYVPAVPLTCGEVIEVG